MPFLFVAPRSAELTHAVSKTFLRTVGALAVIAIAQFAIQILGGPFIDVFSLISKEVVIPGYVHRARLDIAGFEGYLIRSNGMFFLEPSIASQFFALAAILALRIAPASVPLFIAALLFTGSGTGIIALAVGVLGIAITGTSKERVLSVLAASLGLAVLTFTGLLLAFFSRTSEFQTEGSSASFRFLDPWEHVAKFMLDFPAAIMTGYGPGGASLTAVTYGTGVNYTFTPKLVIEYGIVVGLGCTMAMLLFVMKSTDLPLAGRLVILAMTFALSGALGQPASAILVWCFCQPQSHLKTPRATRWDPLFPRSLPTLEASPKRW
ncbi:hypothetical protein ACIP9X_08575 [Arthrobacter sp. NPDC093125]|uniref:hypothetical protein n=1 Tax=Arthrobacter sp. NPDC093125 TaxID=3363944 RepID=UPI003816D493